MRIGYVIDTHQRLDAPPGPDDVRRSMDAMIAEGVAAERAGFHSVQVPERHAHAECRFAGPEQLLTVLARETGRVALGSFTSVATLVHPLKVAEQFSVVDNLSGGRLFATMSRGFMEPFWDQFGVPRGRMLGRFKEALEVHRRAVTGTPFAFDGEHWQVPRGLLAPPPYQPGGWPVWGGGNAVPAAIERCADYGAAWTCDPLPFTDAAWTTDADRYRDRARTLGKVPFVVMMRDGWVADSFEQAAATFGEHYARQVRFYHRSGVLTHHPDITSAADITARSMGPHLVMGSAAGCIEQLERLHEVLGVDYVSLCCRLSTGPGFAETLEQIARFGAEVVGPVHRKYAAPDHPAIPAACRW